MLAINRIVLPTDFSATAVDAEQRARALAQRFEAELHLLHIIGEGRKGDPTSGPKARSTEARGRESAGAAERSRAGSSHDPSGDSDSRALVRRTPRDDTDAPSIEVTRVIQSSHAPHRGILDYADDIDADLLVLGAEAVASSLSPFLGPLFGSVIDRVIRQAERPVVVVRPDLATPAPDDPDRLSARRIVVPVDVSEPMGPFVRHAQSFAAQFQARVEFIHVVEEPRFPVLSEIDPRRAPVPERVVKARSDLHELVHEVGDAGAGLDRTESERCDPARTDASTYVLVGRDPAEEVVRYAEVRSAQFILVAARSPARGLSRIRPRLFGGLTDQIIRTAPCPVGAVKPAFLPSSASRGDE